MVDPDEKGVGIQGQSATLQVNFLFSVHSFTSAKIIIVFSLLIIIIILQDLGSPNFTGSVDDHGRDPDDMVSCATFVVTVGGFCFLCLPSLLSSPHLLSCSLPSPPRLPYPLLPGILKDKIRQLYLNVASP